MLSHYRRFESLGSVRLVCDKEDALEEIRKPELWYSYKGSTSCVLECGVIWGVWSAAYNMHLAEGRYKSSLDSKNAICAADTSDRICNAMPFSFALCNARIPERARHAINASSCH